MKENNNRFKCLHEEERKGVYMEIYSSNKHNNVEFSFFTDFQCSGSVCVNDENVDKIIQQLQEFKDRNK